DAFGAVLVLGVDAVGEVIGPTVVGDEVAIHLGIGGGHPPADALGVVVLDNEVDELGVGSVHVHADIAPAVGGDGVCDLEITVDGEGAVDGEGDVGGAVGIEDSRLVGRGADGKGRGGGTGQRAGE